MKKSVLIFMFAMAASAVAMAGEGGWEEGFGELPATKPTYEGENTCNGFHASEEPVGPCNTVPADTSGWKQPGDVDLTTPFATEEEAAAHCDVYGGGYAISRSWDYGFHRMVYRCVVNIPQGSG